MSNFLYKVTEMLIREAEFIPVTDGINSEFLINENFIVLKKVTGNKTKLLEIYNCDLLTFEEITSKLLSYPYNNKESRISNVNVFCIKVFAFSKMPSETIIDILKNVYTEKTKETNDFACMYVCLENRNIFFSKGFVYPNHMIYDVIAKSLVTDNENCEDNIMNILKEHNSKNKPQIIVVNEDINTSETLSFRISVIYIIFFILLTFSNMFNGILEISFFDYNPLFFVANLVFLSTIGTIVEINFLSLKFLVIILVGALFNSILDPSFIVYSWVFSIVGALMYMRYRTADALNKAKFIKPVLLSYLLIIAGYSLFTNVVSAVVLIAGIIPGFCISGILGFNGDISVPSIKKNLYIILLVYVLVRYSVYLACQTQ